MVDPDVFYDALDQTKDRYLVQDNFERALIRVLPKHPYRKDSVGTMRANLSATFYGWFNTF